MRALVLAGCCGLIVLSAACGSTREPSVTAVPATSIEDEPVSIQVTGLPAEAAVAVGLSSADAQGHEFTSRASFRANEKGRLDVGRQAFARLVASMQARAGVSAGSYRWDEHVPRRFDVTVQSHNRIVARTSFTRRWASRPQIARPLTTDGLFGELFTPAGERNGPGVLVIGGSEGGIATGFLAARLAADGVPALALAYFGTPTLPKTLTNIPLEYFRRALRWLGAQPEVDPRRISVLGVSRGSEAALLLGVHASDLVHGVAALVPSNVVNCGIAGAGRGATCLGPAWTLGGKPLPYTRQFDNPHPTDVPAAVIPVQRMAAPILLACGGADLTWDSCAYARAIRHRAPRATLFAYADAGHDVGAAVPYEPGSRLVDTSFPGDELAREQLWPRLLTFLRGVRG